MKSTGLGHSLPSLSRLVPAVRRLLLSVLPGLLVPVLCLAATDRIAGAQDRGIALADVVKGDAKHALLIGINGYVHDDQLSPLSYAVNDATKLAESLKTAGYKISLMTSDQTGPMQPTHDNVVREFKQLADRVSPNDTFLFFFAGHGFSRPGKGSCLATMDTDLASPEETSLSVELLGQRVEAINCRQAVLVFDACRNPVRAAGQVGGGALPEMLANEIKALGEKDRGMAVLFGCRAGQFSLENPQKRQGVFSYYLVKGLEGEAANPRGEIALSALMDFAQAQVERDSDRRQQPWLNFDGARMISALFILESDGQELKRFGPLDVNSLPLDTGDISVRDVDQLMLRVEGPQPINRGRQPPPLNRGAAWWGAARLTRSHQ